MINKSGKTAFLLFFLGRLRNNHDPTLLLVKLFAVYGEKESDECFEIEPYDEGQEDFHV